MHRTQTLQPSGSCPERLHEEISTDYNDMIYAGTAKEVEARRKSFIRKWRLNCRAVADSLEEAGDRLFTFTRLPDSQWRSARRKPLSRTYTSVCHPARCGQAGFTMFALRCVWLQSSASLNPRYSQPFGCNYPVSFEPGAPAMG